MRKFFVCFAAFAVFFALAAKAGAMSISNPLYMPGEGEIMFDTEAYFKNTTAGASYKVYTATERISYSFSEKVLLGGFLGYSRIEKLNKRDFTNPGVFTWIRLLDNVVKFDIGGEAEFNAFDSREKGGVADGANKYTGKVRAGAELAALSFGVMGQLSYWRGDGVTEYTRNNNREMVNNEAKAFVIFDILDVLGIGGEAGYKTFDMRRDADYKGYFLTGRVDLNPWPSRFGVTGYITFEDLKNTQDTVTIGGVVRLAL